MGCTEGHYPYPATYATGTATFTGLQGSVIPTGTTVLRGDGLAYTTNEERVVGSGGTATVPITAVEDGANGNADAGITLTLTSPIAGVLPAGVSASVITGGADQEDNESLRTRMNQAYASPPQGGAADDYVTWAMSVPGVTRAWVNPLGAGAGTVVVYAMLDQAQAVNGGFPQGTTGVATLETRADPATGDQLTIANCIYPLRPATALVYVAAPAPQPIDITITTLNPNTTAIQAGIAQAIRDLFVRVGTPLGGTIYPSDLNGAIASVSGVNHFTLASPTSPVSIAVGSLPTLGTLTVS
ncbi:baseplate J/gp47 family protein [Siccirubricoccus sp. KC 17139]|uniref:Baseplate J/gp47 family protein n=1 Tax=Siccirubricoccus soli TaxID=2899147 RepID=A0ABT1D0P1_9PROT|nr:baseplate J/gp47 family protein [Siccirubricoccus soli]MCO6414824.1 baseplate J/gp47 family protein [Siccirubricoccus soli]MCP2680954.1 baseplate J/gp47 family protein [Siccirubricoccus soli]